MNAHDAAFDALVKALVWQRVKQKAEEFNKDPDGCTDAYPLFIRAEAADNEADND